MENLLKELLFKPSGKLSIRGFFTNYPVEAYYFLNQSALILGRSDRLWAHLAGDSETDLKVLLDRYHQKTQFYHAVEDHRISLLKKFGAIDWQLSTSLFVRVDEKLPDPPHSRVLPLNSSHADYIHRHSAYNEYTSSFYIADRLEKDISAGVFVDNKLVAWSLTHDDGSLGFMNVLKDYRNKGYARDIAAYMIRKKIQKKEPVFANIEEDNLPAIKLATQLGFKKSIGSSWIKMKW